MDFKKLLIDIKNLKNHSHNELHTHANKKELDGITQTKINEWNNKATTQYVDDSVSTLNTVMKEVEGVSISTETTDGEVQDLVIEGNTFQDSANLSIINSSGELLEDGRYKLSFKCSGKNLWNTNFKTNTMYEHVISGGLEVTMSYKGNPGTFRFYDENKIEIDFWAIRDEGRADGLVSRTFSMVSGSYYVKLEANIAEDVMIEVGKDYTGYLPYEEYIQDIYLPCDLSMVNNIPDRLICKDGVWGIEKNSTLFKPPVNDWKLHSDQQEGYLSVWITNIVLPNSFEINSEVVKSFAIAKGFPVDKVGIVGEVLSIHNFMNVRWIYVRVKNDKASTLEQFKENIAKDIEIMYQAKEPQFIPLSDGQQVKLKTFMHNSNIISLNEVKPTIKGRVPNSLRDTVGSNVKSIDRIDKKLQTTVSELVETTGYEYKSENNYINIKNSKEGTLDNVRIEGNTLVNLSSVSNYAYTNSEIIFNTSYHSFVADVKPNTTYTIIRTEKSVRYVIGEHSEIVKEKSVATKLHTKHGDAIDREDVVKITTGNDAKQIVVYLDNVNTKTCKTIILEGDHTQNPPNFFEGLKSVGELEELEITSVNENLFDGEFEKGAFSNSDGTPIINPAYPNAHRSVNFINVIPNTKYVYNKIDNGRTYFYKKDGTFLSSSINSQLPNMVFTTPNDCYKVKFNFENLISEVIISKGTTPKAYVPHKSDKKKLLYKDVDGTWKPVVLRKWDYIEELENGKYKHHKCSDEKVFKGASDENWIKETKYTSDSNYSHFIINTWAVNGSEVICDKYAWEHSFELKEHIWANFSGINIIVPSSKASTVEEFKSLLANSPATIVYKPLAQEEVYDCIDLSLNSFDGETSVFTNSSIPHRLSVTQKQGLKARVETLEKEMKFMYDNLDTQMVQNMMATAEVCEMVLFLHEQPEQTFRLSAANSYIIDLYCKLVNLGKYTTEQEQENDEIKLVPEYYKEQVKLSLDENN